MMRGETVYVDGVAVENVLVSNSGFNKGAKWATEIDDEVGPVYDFTLYFPSSFDGDIVNKQVVVRGIPCDVINAPGHEEPERVFESWVTSAGFGQWDMVVYADRTQPEYAERVIVTYKRYSRDSLGNRTPVETRTLYTGIAQVRLYKADETAGTASTKSNAEYYFVIPHIHGIDELPTQCVTITYKGDTYDVALIEDVDERGRKTSMRAVRHNANDTAARTFTISPTVSPEASDKSLFNTPVSDIQDGIVVTDGVITGTLKYLSTGDIAGYWGAGYFIALKFGVVDQGVTVKAGLDPSAGSGLVPLDNDRNGVWKISDKQTQRFEVVSTATGNVETLLFDLSGLTLAPQAQAVSNG